MKRKDKINEVLTWFGIINHPAKENASKGDFEAFNECLIKSYSHSFLFATIIHDKDILEDGTIKTIHMHLFINTRDKAYEQQELIEKLAKDFGIPSECISIEPCINAYASIRYLTHKEQKWKTQYSPKDITTNDREEIAKFWLTDMEILQGSNTMQEIAEARSLDFLNKYKSVWKDVKLENDRVKQLEAKLEIYEGYIWLIRQRLTDTITEETKAEILDKINELEGKIAVIQWKNKPDFLDN